MCDLGSGLPVPGCELKSPDLSEQVINRRRHQFAGSFRAEQPVSRLSPTGLARSHIVSYARAKAAWTFHSLGPSLRNRFQFFRKNELGISVVRWEGMNFRTCLPRYLFKIALKRMTGELSMFRGSTAALPGTSVSRYDTRNQSHLRERGTPKQGVPPHPARDDRLRHQSLVKDTVVDATMHRHLFLSSNHTLKFPVQHLPIAAHPPPSRRRTRSFSCPAC